MENSDKTPKVTGIGGIFFFSDDPKETRDWYSKNLGIDTTEWGATFESRNNDDPDIIESMQWSPFKTGSSYFQPSKKSFMINYRVQNIEKLVKNLRENGVTVLDEIEDSEYGKFVHILDSDDNKIELWEPSESK
jgi:predicted enzyme related to lactoylglutathione lyase